MNVFWRFMLTILTSHFSSRLNFFDLSSITLHVLPTDIDLILHMNNGRYLSLMDLGRINFMLRTGLLWTLRKQKIIPVIASEMIRFKKSLLLFQKFELTTQVIGWDNKFFYLEHYFKIREEVYTLGMVKVIFIQEAAGSLSTEAVLSKAKIKLASPPLPAWVLTWNNADQHFYDKSFSS